MNAYNTRTPQVVYMRGGEDLEGLSPVLKGRGAVLPCHLYHATKKYIMATIDTSCSMYTRDGGDNVKMTRDAKGTCKEHVVIGTPLTLVPTYPSIHATSSSQVNSLNGKLSDYYESLLYMQDRIYEHRYNWWHSWGEVLAQTKVILSRAPVLRETGRHTVFAPIPNNGILDMEASGVSEIIKDTNWNSSRNMKYCRMCTAGGFDEIRYRTYDRAYHGALIGRWFAFPEYEGAPGEWQHLNNNGRIRITGEWIGRPCNASVICILKLDKDRKIMDDPTDFGMLVLQFDIEIELKGASRIE